VIRLDKKLDEVTENFNVEQAKREISNTERSRGRASSMKGRMFFCCYAML
jgi:hypothetical protein